MTIVSRNIHSHDNTHVIFILMITLGPHGAGDSGLNPAETRSHFWSWVIVSSPLTLSMDVTNDTIMDEVYC